MAKNLLTAKHINHWDGLDPKFLSDGEGLELCANADGSNKRWRIRLNILKSMGGQGRTYKGLGSYPTHSLAEARSKAEELRAFAQQGIDGTKINNSAGRETFKESFEIFWADNKLTYKNAKHQAQWVSTMARYAYPVIGDILTEKITTNHIIDILRPMRRDVPETAQRFQGRLSRVFRSARARGVCSEDPTLYVDEHLPKSKRRPKHYPALPWQEIPAFVRDLQNSTADPVTRLCMEFAALTVTRSGEVRGARWSELDLHEALWTIPAQRMKGGVEHCVPLSSRAIDILHIMHDKPVAGSDAGLVFPAHRGGEMSDNTLSSLIRRMGLAGRHTPHGCRSSFKDWAEDNDICRSTVSEAALAHAVKDKVDAAYRRTKYLDERRQVMETWAHFISSTNIAEKQQRELAS